MYNLPNILTISRIVVIPVIFLSVYITNVLWLGLAAFLFIVAAITDYFDGYFARSLNQTSVLGRLLDPIADKLLVVSALLIIVANQMVHPISYIPVMVILCREVLVSGLREFLADVKISMPVTNLAKWKTGFQMTSLAMILSSAVPFLRYFGCLGEVLLWVAGILTFITGYEYFQKSLDYVKSTEKAKKTKTSDKAEVKSKKVAPVKKATKKATKAKSASSAIAKAPSKTSVKKSSSATTKTKKTASTSKPSAKKAPAVKK